MRWTTVTSPIGELRLSTDGTALTGLLFAGGADPRGERDPAHPLLAEAARELGEYFDGTRTEFEVPLAPAGSDFERRVWTGLLAIPYGHTATYAEIAARVGQPRAARAVGMANSLNPIAIIVPCHRVVGPNGSLTGYAAGSEVKARLLELEAGVRGRAEFKAA